MTPRISVVMSVYNGEKYLKQAVESILNQTLRDFEFIIIDDGSTDSTISILSDYGKGEHRIVLHHAEQNQGLANSLNLGLRLAQGEFIARMDSDDISLAGRLDEQVTFMDEHPEIGVCGTGFEPIGKTRQEQREMPTIHDAIHSRMLFNNTIAHPSVMIRASVLKQHGLEYDTHVRYAQDYELWSRMINITRFAVLPKILLRYRVHESQISKLYHSQQRLMLNRIHSQFLTPIGLECSDRQLFIHRRIVSGQYGSEPAFLVSSRDWLEQIQETNRRSKIICPEILGDELAWRWTTIINRYYRNPMKITRAVFQSPLPFNNRRGIHKTISLVQLFVQKK